MRLACFASGSGSNVEALFEAIEAGRLQATIELVVCDQKEALVIERARRHGCDVFVFTAKDYPDKPSFEREIVAELERRDVERIILAGYMRLVGDV
ncbi:MAG: formyltransferase family protein, partial [Exiguobacterium oxidotolerans]